MNVTQEVTVLQSAKENSTVTCHGTAEITVFVGLNRMTWKFLVSNEIDDKAVISWNQLVKEYPNTQHGSRQDGSHFMTINGTNFLYSPEDNVWRSEVMDSIGFSAACGSFTKDTEEDTSMSSSKAGRAFSIQRKAMTRTRDIETKELARITSEMRSNGAEDEHLEHLTQLFYFSEQHRIAALEAPPVARGSLDFDIELVDGAKYFKQPRRRFDASRSAVISDYVKHQVEIGRYRIVGPQEVDCISNFTLVLKPDDSYRPCGDYKDLNAITKENPAYVPSVKDVMRELPHGEVFFFTADVEAGYNVLKATERTQRLMALWLPDGQLCTPCVMPFGVKNASAQFDAFVTHAISTHTQVAHYVDDIHAGAPTWAALMKILDKTVHVLAEHGIFFSFRKFHIGRKVPLLGAIRNDEGLHANPENVAPLRNFPSPTCLEDLRRLLGMLRYLEKFTPNLGLSLGPLNSLCSTKRTWQWNEENEAVLRTAANLLADRIALNFPNFAVPFRLDVDASLKGWGYLLYQETDGVVSILRLGSTAFTGTMLGAAPIHCEAHALVHSLLSVEDIVGNFTTHIRGDHRPLIWLLNDATVSVRTWGGKLVRWVMILQNFSWTLKHIPGDQNVVPDTLSRYYVHHKGLKGNRRRGQSQRHTRDLFVIRPMSRRTTTTKFLHQRFNS